MNNQNDQPLVSIIIPVYNGSNYVKEAIDSALAQTYGNLEIIVVNDGSSDNGLTEEIALSYGDRIRYIAKEENGGVSSALNVGIRNMKGEYFSWLSHDDRYTPEKIASQVELLTALKRERVVAICDYSCINASSKPLFDIHKFCFENGKIYDWGVPLSAVFERGSLHGCGLMIPKRAFEECGMFDEKMRYCQDAQMWAMIFISGYSLIATDGKFVEARVHDKQLTQTGKSIFHSDCILMADRLLPDLLRVSDKKNNYLYMFAKFHAKHNSETVVTKCIEYAKHKKLFSIFNALNLKILISYGKIRPFIRKMYYSVVRKVKTQG